jgi:hypothetical protein
MKQLIDKNHLSSIRDVVSKALSGEGEDVFSAVGNPENLFRLLRRYKESVINPKPYFNNLLNLSQRLLKTVRNEEFYKYSPEIKAICQYIKYILFYSSSLIRKLYNRLYGVLT